MHNLPAELDHCVSDQKQQSTAVRLYVLIIQNLPAVDDRKVLIQH